MDKITEKLVEENIDLVFSLGKEFQNYFEEEGIQQVALVAMIKAIHSFNPELNGDFRLFLKEEMLNEVLNFISIQKASEITIPFAGMWKDKILTLFKELPTIEKQVVIQRFIDDKTQGQVAEILKISVEEVKTIEKNSIEKLKKVMKGKSI